MSTQELRTEDIVAQLSDVDPNLLSDLHTALTRRAGEEGSLDIAYRTVDSPVGTLLLAATEAGLVRVAFGIEDHDQVLISLAQQISPRILLAPGRLDPVVRQLSEYFAGQRKSFELPLDFRLSSGFRRQVLAHLPEIGYGHTESYAQVAAATGNPRAVRAVGSACATNPIPVVVPCHRVVRSDGTSGGYRGGPEAKKSLLALEAAA